MPVVETKLLAYPSPQPRSWVLVCLVFLVSAQDMISMMHTAAFLPDWIIERGLDVSWSSAMFGTQMFATAGSSLFGASVMHRSSPVSMFIVATAVIAVLNLVQAFVPPLLSGAPLGVLLLAIRAVMGISEGFLVVGGNVIIGRNVPIEQIPTYLGISEGFKQLGNMIGPLYGGPLFSLGGWYLPFLTLGVQMGLAASGLHYYARRLPRIKEKNNPPWAKMKTMLGTYPFLVAIVVCVIGESDLPTVRTDCQLPQYRRGRACPSCN